MHQSIGKCARLIFLIAMIAALTSCFPMRGDPSYFEVTDSHDAEDDNIGDGLCRSTLTSGACTLRAAVSESNAMPGENTIQLGRTVYTLSLVDHLAITDNLRILGTDVTQTVVNGANRGGRIFYVDSATAWITHLTMTDGGNDVPSGGALRIDNGAFVSLANVVIKDSEAFSGGGAVHLSNGTLSMVDSTIAGNRATGAFAGGIWVTEGRLLIDRSTLESNSSNRCGAIYNFGVMTITNSTIAGNSALSTSRGTGGIINIGTAHLNNVTLYNNSSAARGDDQSSGGLNISEAPARATMSNSIVAGNTRGGSANDCTGEITSYGYNLVETTGGCVLSGTVAGNITGRDPQLLPLRFNSGFTRSHRPSSSSPAIGAGHPQVGPGISALGRCDARDQAGHLRQLTGSGRRCDIGSIEGS